MTGPLQRATVAVLLAFAYAPGVGAQTPAEPAGVPRFAAPSDPNQLVGPARPGFYVGDMGRRAAVFGDETGALEVWTWPLELVENLHLAFGILDYDEPLDGATVARRVVVRPEGVTIVYSHATFTVRERITVPLHEPGVLILLDVETVRPLDVYVRMRSDFNLAWPGSFGGQYITWWPERKAFLLSQGGVHHYNALIGSPFAVSGTSQPAHDAPTRPSQFLLRFDTARTTRELIPIVVAGGAAPQDSVEAVYGRILAHAQDYVAEKAAHYDSVRTGELALRSPAPDLDRALEWAKVNLDQQLVCNPDLGCGLVAGYGPSGPGNHRPGFGWFFGGDAAINSFAMDGLGQLGLVRQGLSFSARYQRDDGKIPHEISQAADRLPWFKEYPYVYFHGDTTPFWLLACYRYWLASGDDAFLREHWPQMLKAYHWSEATDRDGDGLMENPAAGAGAIEVGGLGEALHTDIYLAGVWVSSLTGVEAMARHMGQSALADSAAALLKRARATLEKEYWLDDEGIYAFALLQGNGAAAAGSRRAAGRPDLRVNDALTVWPTTAIAFGTLDPDHADRMLARLSASDITTDWGTRLLSTRHPLYQPLHYNNGAVWPFMTGFTALAHYRAHRGWAGWSLVRDIARTTFDFARGRNPELMSGAFYRTLDTAVPQQFFSTSMMVTALVQGLLGLQADAPAGSLTVEPHLPARWDSVAARNFRVGADSVDLAVHREAGIYELDLRRRGPEALTAHVSPGLPLGARVRRITVDGRDVPAQARETAHDVHPAVNVDLKGETRIVITYDGGVEIAAPSDTVRVGDSPHGLRILDFRRDGAGYAVDLQGLTGSTHTVMLRTRGRVSALRGATRDDAPAGWVALRVVFPGNGGGSAAYVPAHVSFRLGS
ncbi:MAG TPA: GH116 family glycosyl hydrolase [Longimicrobiales bacterium]|nr:GH116 family glycosyl hydrolase [Longimicrobiales bacterium]